MHAGMNEFLEEQTKGLTEMVRGIRKSRVAAARKAAIESAARIRALNGRVRELARSGVRLSSISQSAAESLIELQSEIVTTALHEAAEQLQRIADTDSVRDLARDQAEVLQAAQQRIVKDMARAMKILKGAASDARQVATRAATVEPAAPRKAVRRKAKGKAKAKAKTKVRATAKTRAKTPAERKARKTVRRARRSRT